jgi:cation:H+ antiporter
MKVQPFVIALTLVAFGTSAPELAISVHSAIKGYEGITLGNIIGSNIANVLFALPLAFLIRIPKSCDLKNVDFIYLLIATIIYIYVIILIGSFSKFSGLAMLFLLFSYLAFVLYQASKGIRKIDIDDIEKNLSLKKSILLSFLGIIGIIFGAQILVKGAVMTANSFGVSQTIIGLTVIALGTSIPEVVTSMFAALRGQINFVLGAILGSNLFNLLAITGIASVITPINTKGVLSKVDIYYLVFSTIIFILISLLLKFLNKKLVFAVLISYFIYVVFIYLRMI